jgi:UDP-2,3-diacylglucosamine hydrolase
MDLPIYFISDIHLMLERSESEVSRQNKLFQFFSFVKKSGGTLVINGDLFDFYFEYKDVIPKVYVPFYHEILKLREAGVKVHFVLGNHDYWVLDFITETLFDYTYFSDTIFEINGKRFYVTHGDGYLSWDLGYRILKSFIHSRLFIWSYRLIHPRIGYAFGRWISKKGEHYLHSDAYNKRICDEMSMHAQKQLDQGYDYFITGHYHQAKDLPLNGGKLIILGDWLSFFSYAKFDGHDLKLKFWDNHETP